MAATRWQLTALTLCVILAAPFALHAAIYRWDNGQVIPGTEGIEPGPGVQLDRMQLEYAKLGGSNPDEAMDLTGANFEASNLTNAILGSSALTNANLRQANLTNANLGSSALTNADLTGANLNDARLWDSALTNANLTGANLNDARLFRSTLTNANLTGAVVTGAGFWNTTSFGFTAAQLYSTQSYQAKDLSGIDLTDNDLTGWDFSGQNLTDANLGGSTLTDANLTGAVVTGAGFWNTTSLGFTAAQLYSTQSYQAKDLSRIRLEYNNDLTGWDFSGQNLTDADLSDSTLSNADLTGANLNNASLYQSTLTNANLTNVDLGGCALTRADLTGANLRNSRLIGALSLTSAKFSPGSVYSQWTVFPEGFNPTTAGLTMVMSPKGDLDADDALDAADVDMLANKMNGRGIQLWWLPDAAFGMNGDSIIDQEDHRFWVKDLAHTWFGDADLNGEFGSADFVQVFQAGKYETAEDAGWDTGWSEGDWNGDGLFDSNDMVTAFMDGGYEQGPRTDVAAVPEPGGVVLLLLGLVGVMRRKTTAQNRI